MLRFRTLCNVTRRFIAFPLAPALHPVARFRLPLLGLLGHEVHDGSGLLDGQANGGKFAQEVAAHNSTPAKNAMATNQPHPLLSNTSRTTAHAAQNIAQMALHDALKPPSPALHGR
mgnify:CR=1 FL=1